MELDQQVAGLCLFDKCQKFVADGFRTANDDRGAFVEFLPVFVLGGESLSLVLGNLLDNVLFPLLFKSEHFLVSELVHILFVVLADTHLL